MVGEGRIVLGRVAISIGTTAEGGTAESTGSFDVDGVVSTVPSITLNYLCNRRVSVV